REVRGPHGPGPESPERALRGGPRFPRARRHRHRGRPGGVRMSLDGVATRVGPEAVVVTAERELIVLSSAVVGGGLARARAVLNVHVPKNFACADAEGTVAAAALRLGVPAPWVGLLTGAPTERAEIATAAAGPSGDAIVVAATGRGTRCRYGGPVTDVGWAAASAARGALEAAVRRWLAEHAPGGPRA